jgi:hypothetical protein
LKIVKIFNNVKIVVQKAKVENCSETAKIGGLVGDCLGGSEDPCCECSQIKKISVVKIVMKDFEKHKF